MTTSSTPSRPTVFVDAQPTLPLVHLMIAGQGGAHLEPAPLAGLAVFHSRMLRRGSGTLDTAAFEAEIDRLGAELLVDTQCSTFAVHGTVLRRNLAPFVRLICQMFAAPRFDDAEIDRLKREIEAQRVEVLDSDDALSRLAFRRTMLAGHPYGRPLGGTRDSIAPIDACILHDYHRKAFPRDRLTFGFAGSITQVEAEAVAAEIDAAIPRPSESVSLAVSAVPPLGGRHLLIVNKAERTQTQLLVGTRGSHPHDPDHAALGVGVAVFGGTFTSRLVREIRSKRGWSYSVSARISSERIRTSFVMSAQPSVSDSGPCLGLMLGLLSDWIEKGITARELGGMRKYLTRSSVFDRDTAHKRMHRAVEERVLELGDGYHDRWLASVATLALDEVNAAIASRIDAAALRVVAVCTEAELGVALAAAIPSLAARKVVSAEAIAQGIPLETVAAA